MEQLDVFDLEDLKQTPPCDDDLIKIATNILLLPIKRAKDFEANADNVVLAVQLDRNAINAATAILKKSSGFFDKKQIETESIIIIKGGLSNNEEIQQSGVTIEEWK